MPLTASHAEVKGSLRQVFGGPRGVRDGAWGSPCIARAPAPNEWSAEGTEGLEVAGPTGTFGAGQEVSLPHTHTHTQACLSQGPSPQSSSLRGLTAD